VQRFGRAEHARGPEIRVYRISPDSARALIRARGAPALEAACEAAGPLHLPDFLPFVEGVARAALGRGQWSMAEQYYQVLLQRGPQAGMGREQQVALERMLAALRAKAAAKSTGSPEERGR